MATRTVRLDDEAEAALQEILEATGLPISEALKRGLRQLRAQIREQGAITAYSVFKDLDLGPGGYAKSPATDVKQGVARALARKHRK